MGLCIEVSRSEAAVVPVEQLTPEVCCSCHTLPRWLYGSKPVLRRIHITLLIEPSFTSVMCVVLSLM